MIKDLYRRCQKFILAELLLVIALMVGLGIVVGLIELCRFVLFPDQTSGPPCKPSTFMQKLLASV